MICMVIGLLIGFGAGIAFMVVTDFITTPDRVRR